MENDEITKVRLIVHTGRTTGIKIIYVRGDVDTVLDSVVKNMLGGNIEPVIAIEIMTKEVV